MAADIEDTAGLADDFQAQAKRCQKRHQSVGCFGLAAVMAVFLTVLFTCPWYWAFLALGAGVFVLDRLRPGPWPNCPACAASFRSLGSYCPNCGDDLPPEATSRKASCGACGYDMFISSKAPMYKQRYGRSSDYRLKLVPVRYCTHCRVRLGK